MTAEPKDERLAAWLATDRVDAPGDDLVRRILASAPAPDAAPWWRTNWLWPGAGLAGIGLAGSFAGAFAVSVALGATTARGNDAAERPSAFSAIPADWSEE